MLEINIYKLSFIHSFVLRLSAMYIGVCVVGNHIQVQHNRMCTETDFQRDQKRQQIHEFASISHISLTIAK